MDLSTPATIALSFVVCVSGVMLLLGVGRGFVQGAHEWLGLAFVIVSVLHVCRHWRPMRGYLSSGRFWGTCAVVGALTLLFVVPSASFGGGHDGMHAMMQVVSSAPIDRLAPMVGSTPDALVAKFKAAGLVVEGSSQTLEQLAARSGRPVPEIIGLAVSDSRVD